MPYIHEISEIVTRRNSRIGQGVTGICQSLNKLEWLDDCYQSLKSFDIEWSKQQGYSASIKLTTVKPSGTLSLLAGATPGVHPAYARYYIRRVRMSSADSLVEYCRNAGYKVEYAKGFDGTHNYDTVVVEFPCFTGENTIIAADMTAVEQLELVKKIQTIWSDNAVSVTVYYRLEELPEIKQWLAEHYEIGIKSVSFLLHSEHGFTQAPYEEVTADEYYRLAEGIKSAGNIEGDMLDIDGCDNGVCPIR